jgi:glucose-1-phosphate thymidylyltransferase
MAGIGKRMRPHTLTVPKPLLPVAGKPMVQHLVEDLMTVAGGAIDEIGFVIGNFGKEVENKLLTIAGNAGANGKIFYQNEALGTAHAVLCAGEMLEGKVIIAFSDTLFRGKVTVDEKQDGVIWVQKVDDPARFGVVKLDSNNYITAFVEKPAEFVSDLAIIGIYYFRDGATLKRELQYVIDKDIKEKGEYWLTTAMENMKKKGIKFVPAQMEEWLDCGTKEATLFTNRRLLEIKSAGNRLPVQFHNSIVIQPCNIAEDAQIRNSVIGPFVSIGSKSEIDYSIISDSIIMEKSVIVNANISGSMVGNQVYLKGIQDNVNLGDYTVFNG